MSPHDTLRSTAFRIALVFSIVVALLTASVFSVIYHQVADADVARLRSVMRDEAQAAAAGDVGRLHRALRLRLTHDYRRMDYVGLYDSVGVLLLGNLTTRPDIPIDGKAHYVAAYQRSDVPDVDAEPVLFVARLRPDGGVVYLGRNLQELFTLRRAVAMALAIAIVPTALAALAAGVFFSRRMSARLTGINDSIASIVEGDLRARLPVSEGGDELDRVSRGVNGMLDEIERLLDQLANVGDNIAHDLRSPLTTVRAMLENVLRDDRMPERDAAGVRSALELLDRVMATIAALLRVSSVENGRRRSAFSTIDLSAVCADAYEFFAPAAEAMGVEMTLDAHEPVQIKGDLDLMREAVANILDNAVKFTPRGGAISIVCTRSDGEPSIIVADNGPGVPVEDRRRIFNRFYRGRGGDAAPGSGIGLNIAAMIANLHGFELTVEDNRPGAKFIMTPGAKAVLGLQQTKSKRSKSRVPDERSSNGPAADSLSNSMDS